MADTAPKVKAAWKGETPEGPFACPVEGCDRRFGPMSLLHQHLTERWFGGHGLNVEWTIRVESVESP